MLQRNKLREIKKKQSKEKRIKGKLSSKLKRTQRGKISRKKNRQ